MFSVVGATLSLVVRPSTWTRPVREALAQQILQTAIYAIPFTLLTALAIAVFVVLQAQQWLDRLGHTSLLGPLLVVAVVRELGPLITNLLVIGRSGSGMTSELASMKASGEVNLLDAQGVDPFVYLVVPRVLGTGIAVLCLTVILLLTSFVAGRLLMVMISSDPTPLVTFADQVLKSLEVVDLFNFLAKTLLTGMLTGAICCVTGLHAVGQASAVTSAPRAAFVRSIAALLIVSVFVSAVIYLGGG
ncbi:ABC transporter permease [Mucisphaera sp.]|uniref:ABC transporter permease n=1 Tax=Mucisphaera sp. TaxID=2913024 RepID=UPI003D14F693